MPGRKGSKGGVIAGKDLPGGRELVDAIIADIAKGEAGYKAAEAHGVPFGTFWGWIASDPEVSEKYVRAKSAGLDRLAEEIVALSDEARPGRRVLTKADGSEEVTTVDMVERTKLQIDVRKWLLSKLAPKKYGDKLDVEHKGGITVTLSGSDADLV